MAICYLNFTVIASFLVIFVIIIIKITIIIIIEIFSVIRTKPRFWRPKKEDQVARIGVTGGFRWFGQCPKEKFFPIDVFPYGLLPNTPWSVIDPLTAVSSRNLKSAKAMEKRF